MRKVPNTLNLRIDDKTKNLLSKHAEELGITMSAYARLILKTNAIKLINVKTGN